jgi:hypothetical protein
VRGKGWLKNSVCVLVLKCFDGHEKTNPFISKISEVFPICQFSICIDKIFAFL